MHGSDFVIFATSHFYSCKLIFPLDFFLSKNIHMIFFKRMCIILHMHLCVCVKFVFTSVCGSEISFCVRVIMDQYVHWSICIWIFKKCFPVQTIQPVIHVAAKKTKMKIFILEKKKKEKKNIIGCNIRYPKNNLILKYQNFDSL